MNAKATGKIIFLMNNDLKQILIGMVSDGASFLRRENKFCFFKIKNKLQKGFIKKKKV